MCIVYLLFIGLLIYSNFRLSHFSSVISNLSYYRLQANVFNTVCPIFNFRDFTFLCVCVGVCVCVCLAYTSEDFHMKTHRYTEDSTPTEDPKTGPRKTLAKNAKNVMFYHLTGVRAPRTSTDFQPYLIYEDIRVLGSISKASGGVCVCV